MQPYDALLAVLENPDSQKGYNDLKKYYESLGCHYEAEALMQLLNEKFHAQHPNPNTQQSSNN